MVMGDKGCFGQSSFLAVAGLVIAATVFTQFYGNNELQPASPPFTYLGNATYSQALSIALAFFDVQKSGKLPSDNPITWRGDSGLTDGSDVGVDLTGGMYDAGDNVKFSFPLAFTSTLLSWSVLEYSSELASAQLLNSTKSNIKWITDYLIKTHNSSEELYFQIGDPSVDHACWQRPEDMNGSRPSYRINTTFPGSDVAAEVSAAMASASLVFRKDQTSYSNELLNHAVELFHFANTSRGLYSSSFPVEISYYNSTGYGDELLWAASWLFYATGNVSYLKYVTGNAGRNYAQWGKAPAWFSWDNKLPGVQVLLSRYYILQARGGSKAVVKGLKEYKKTADALMCALLPDSPTATRHRSNAGLIWVIEWDANQHAVSSALLALMYSDYLFTAEGMKLHCSGQDFSSQDLRNFAISQANYLLGENPNGMSYLVGYSSSYPQQVHHRAASIPSNGISYGCKDGFQWYNATSPNPHIAMGALVGGPFQNDSFIDIRKNSMQNEPTTYNSAAMVGLLAGLISSGQVSVPPWT